MLCYVTFSRHIKRINYMLIELLRVQKRSIYPVQNDLPTGTKLLSTKWPKNSEYRMTMVQNDQVPLCVEVGI